MNIKNNKGFTGIDFSVAVIVILIFIPTVFGIVYNMKTTEIKTSRQKNAVNIATDILEIAKKTNYEEVSTNVDSELMGNIINKGYIIKQHDESIPADENAVFSYSDENDIHYSVQLGVSRYFPDDNNIEESSLDLVKQVTVTVTYPIGNQTKSIDISTIIQNI